MNVQSPAFATEPESLSTFGTAEQAKFAARYPEGPHILRHNLGLHPLLELDALADLAERIAANHGVSLSAVDRRGFCRGCHGQRR